MKSPCVKQCRLDPQTQICLGCGRTLHQLQIWGSLTLPEQIQIIDQLQNEILEDPLRNRTLTP